MRALIVTFDPPEKVGGVEGRLGGYVKELIRMKQFVEVESFHPSHRLSSAEFNGAMLYECPSDLRHLPGMYSFTMKRMKESRIDSIFLLSGGLTALGLLVLLSCRLTGRRSAMLLYGKDVLQARRRFIGGLLLRASTALADRVLTNSRFTASLVPFVRGGKIRTLYPGVDPAVAAGTDAPPSGSGKRVLFVGRLIKRKGVKDLLDAFRILSDEVPDASLEVVGDGPERGELERLATDLGLGSRVSFMGTMRGPPLYQRYTACQVLAMPSITLGDDVEGFGTVFLEAGLFGKPSVGTFSGGIPEAIAANETGLLVHEGHVEEIAAALKRILTDPELALSLGQNARTRVLTEFTWAESAKQLVASLVSR